MIRLKLNEMLEKRGLSAYALHIKSGERLHQSVISKIKKNDSKALQLDTLDMLCELLDCQPADLIVYESATQSAIATQSETTTQNVERATRNVKHTQNVNTTQSASDNDDLPELSEGDFWLSTEEVARSIGIQERTVRDMYNHKKYPLTRHPTTKGSFVKHSDLLSYIAERDKRIIKKAKGL